MTELSERVEAWKSTVEPGFVDQPSAMNTDSNPSSIEFIMLSDRVPLGDKTRRLLKVGVAHQTNPGNSG
jgi:hypothetical protein